MFVDDLDDSDKQTKNRRKIPITLIATLILQTCTGLWWAASFSVKTEARLNNIERQQQVLDQMPERMARQEAQLEAMNQVLEDIRDELRNFRSDSGRRGR